jgi:hypothetical protein
VIPINNLPLKRLRDNNFIAKVDNRSATDYASLIVIVELFDSLKTGAGLLMRADGRKVQGGRIVIINGKDFINAVNLIDRVGRNGMTAKEIGKNVVHSRKVDNFCSILLNNQLPAADTISIEVCKGKAFVICIDFDNVTKKDSAMLLESFDNG